MKHKGKISITRPSCGDGREYISIRLEDKDSHIKFVEVEVDYGEFTKALTGLAGSQCLLKFHNLENVGKIKEHDNISFIMPEHNYDDKDKVASIAAISACPKGWEPSLYFRSQKSFYRIDGVEFARTTIHRWVDRDGGKDGSNI